MTGVQTCALPISRLRAEAGERFADDVTAELTALAMPHARISVVLTPLAEPGPHGADDVEIRLASNPGAPALPLHKGASGGELSRVMLAIEVVFAGSGGPPTLVFDEVDVVDDRDVTRAQPPDESLGPPIEPQSAGDHSRFGVPGPAQDW